MHMRFKTLGGENLSFFTVSSNSDFFVSVLTFHSSHLSEVLNYPNTVYVAYALKYAHTYTVRTYTVHTYLVYI